MNTTIKSGMSRVLIAAMLLSAAPMATALHLPTTTINGRQYYYFKSKEKISVYGLSKRLGLTREEIVEHNPQTVDGIKRGTTLYFPVDEFADRNEPGYEELEADLKKMEDNPQQLSTMPVRVPQMQTQPADEQLEADLKAMADNPQQVSTMPVRVPQLQSQPVDEHYGSPSLREDFENDRIEASLRELPEPTVTVTDTTANRSSIVLLLPFMLEQEAPTRQSRLYTDFYKGFLIAADTLCGRDNPSGRVTTLTAIDTRGDSRHALELMDSDERVRRAAVVIASVPEASDFAAMAERARANGNYLLNAFDFRDTLYMSNPAVIQPNIPQQAMYAKAVDALMADFAGYTPVVLRSDGGRNEKEAFVDYMRSRYEAEGIDVKQITYKNALHRDDLDSLGDVMAGRHVFIPSSGSTAEFNRFAYVLKAVKEQADAAAVDSDSRSRVAVFGYPDWAAFRGDALDMLHSLEACIYSRFYDNFTSFDFRNIDSDFRRWYGAPMVESIPTQGLLGYDLGCYLLRNLRANDGYFNPQMPYDGIQSVIDLRRAAAAAGGYVNSALYIITYCPGGITSAKTI